MKQYKFSTLAYEPTDFQATQQRIDELYDRVHRAGNFRVIEEALKEYNEILSDISFHYAYSYIRTSLDCTDEFYEKAAMQEAMGLAKLDFTALQTAFCECIFTDRIDELYGCEFLRKMRDEAKTSAPEAAELRSREQELIAKYQQMKASTKCEFQGKTFSEGGIIKYFQSTNRIERIESRKACNKAFLKDKETYFDILRELVTVRNEMAKKNGFDTYFDYANLTHGRNDYGENELTEFCEQVKKHLVPIIKDIRVKQKKELGLDKLMSYDLSLMFQSGNPVPAGDAKVLTQASIKMYDDLSEECGIFFRNMVDTESLNVESSPNKIAGMGFCTDLGIDYLPFIFGNCNGTDSDVAVFTHEVGHAWQGYLSAMNNLPFALLNPPTDLAEIPSKTMELFSYPYAEAFFNKDADKFRKGHFLKAIFEIAAYCEIFEMETYLYTHPEASIDEWIDACMKIEKEYEPDLDYGELYEDIKQGASFVRNMAVYMFPRYVISYALSEMCAMDFYKGMEENPKKAWESYVQLCEAGGSIAYPALLSSVGLQPAYEDGVVERIAGFIKSKVDKLM